MKSCLKAVHSKPQVKKLSALHLHGGSEMPRFLGLDALPLGLKGGELLRMLLTSDFI